MAILRHAGLLLALGVVLCAVTACAGTAGQASTQPPPTRAETPPAIGPDGAVADPRAIDQRPHRWTRYDVLDDRTLRIHYTITGSPQCNVLGRVEVAESAQTVTITLHIGRWPTAGCAAKILKAADLFTRVELPTPLGTRTATDGMA